MKFSINDFFSKCDENIIFCAVLFSKLNFETFSYQCKFNGKIKQLKE